MAAGRSGSRRPRESRLRPRHRGPGTGPISPAGARLQSNRSPSGPNASDRSSISSPRATPAQRSLRTCTFALKTVGNLVSGILAKLHVADRAQVAAGRSTQASADSPTASLRRPDGRTRMSRPVPTGQDGCPLRSGLAPDDAQWCSSRASRPCQRRAAARRAVNCAAIRDTTATSPKKRRDFIREGIRR
jgi:hypothetical protein